MRVTSCKCGCGQTVRGKHVFVNKEHQLSWMNRGGAKELNDLIPDEARAQGGRIAGSMALKSGRLREASLKGAARSREIAEGFRRK